MTPERSPKPINRRLSIRNIFATAASEKKEDNQKKEDNLSSSDPAVSHARDIFEFSDENTSSNAVAAVVPENPKPINRPVLFRSLAVSDVKEEDDPGSSVLAVRVATAVSKKNQGATAVSDGKEEDDHDSSVPAIDAVAAASEKNHNDLVSNDAAFIDATVVSDRKKEDDPGGSDPTLHDALDTTTTTIDVTDIDGDIINQPTQLLSFPFLGGALVEQAAQGLNLCDPMQDFVTADLITMQLEKSVGRNSVVTISELDRSSLNPATYINDNVIDFWMLWLTRHISTEVCRIMFFTCHFYSSLLNEKLGLQHVSGWMEGRKLDIFSKDVLVFPINGDNHWSLLVLYYPGLVRLSVDSGSTDNCAPIIIHLDSLKYHNGYHIAKNIRTFLNWEWSKKKGSSGGVMFNEFSCPVIIPKVPQQKNGFDCGLYICQYAFAIFKIREQIFSNKDVFLITNNKHFQFGQRHINQFRKQLGKLLDNLSQVYRYGSLSKGKSLRQDNAVINASVRKKQDTKENTVSNASVTKNQDTKENAVSDLSVRKKQDTKENAVGDASVRKKLDTKENAASDAIVRKKQDASVRKKLDTKENAASDAIVRKKQDTKENAVSDVSVMKKQDTKENAVSDASVRKKLDTKENAASDTKENENLDVDLDPFIGKPVAIDLSNPYGKQLMVEFGFKLTFEAVCFELNNEAGHLLGTVMRQIKHNKTNRYQVVWQFSALGETALPLSAVLNGHKEAEQLTMVRKAKSPSVVAKASRVKREKQMEQLLTYMSDDEEEMGAPSSDDSSCSDDEKYDSDLSDWDILDNCEPMFGGKDDDKPNVKSPEISNSMDGLHWEFNGKIHQLSTGMMAPQNTQVKAGKQHLFSSPLSSMMTIFPLLFWDKIVQEINRYATQKIQNRLGQNNIRRPRLIIGYKWQDVTRAEIMTYFGILMYSMLYPQTGRRIRDYWNSPMLSAWTKFMSRGRYLQISSVLHFNDNDDEDGRARDSLHKIRPLLNVVKKTLGQYAVIGSEISYDEATMANKSSFGRNLICFNPMKPTGKFHFKFYMICCAKTNLTIRMKIHTKDNSDLELEDGQHEFMNKLDNQTLQLCKPLYNSGCTVNMDNYYMSTTCAMKLRQNGVFCRGTIRSNRKFVPKSILFTPSEARTLPRGTHRIAINEEHQMIAIGWLDNKPVHFISTADTTDIVQVQRKSGAEKIHVSAPMAVANYNKYMGGVDRHDRLRSTFSLCKRLKFKKYYVKLLLFLLDVGLTNAWVYYKLCNEELCNKEGARADFFQALAEGMVNTQTNWNDFQRDDSDISSFLPAQLRPEENSSIKCQPIHLNDLRSNLSMKIKICQVCKYEMRKPKWKSVMLCPTHGVRLCLEVREQRQNCLPTIRKKDGSPVTDWSWTCETTDSCWNKYHKFYRPKGLFNNNFFFGAGEKVRFAHYIYISPLYQKKYAALGIPVNMKNGNQTGVGRIDETWHLADTSKEKSISKKRKREITYLEQDSEDDDCVRHASL